MEERADSVEKEGALDPTGSAQKTRFLALVKEVDTFILKTLSTVVHLNHYVHRVLYLYIEELLGL